MTTHIDHSEAQRRQKDLYAVSDRLVQLVGKWHAADLPGSRCWFLGVELAAAAG
jgi:hypothetical protein